MDSNIQLCYFNIIYCINLRPLEKRRLMNLVREHFMNILSNIMPIYHYLERADTA